ncbi:MAG: ubiquinol-cytochrome C reductase [Opitutaceae bacterium]|jgi:predicted RNA-binding protein with PUA-like domain|nr:ubiquinol-cytochrome C reductase [Opitutaceae bacterium]
MTKQYWLVKSEPEAYSWADLLKEGETDWTGVRNYQARIHLNAMRKGDRVFFYESVSTKAVVGITEVTEIATEDKTADKQGWVSVKLKAVKAIAQPVTLARVKEEKSLADIALIRQSRLSVMPLSKDEFTQIVNLGKKGA